MLFNQPLAVRFGTHLISELSDVKWTKFHFAVAWVRRSGMKHLEPALRAFLKRGGSITGVVGLDLQNTTQQGLEALLDLRQHGQARIYVFHNEDPGSTFHPKLYLLQGKTNAQLIVGSNNLTEAGLFTNVEAGLTIGTKVGDPIITDAIEAFAAWCDPSTGLSRRLNPSLLRSLIMQGYAPDEAALAKQRKATPTPKSGVTRIKLFASRHFSAPKSAPTKAVAKKPGAKSSSTSPSTYTPPTPGTGTVLLMRLRKSRGSQTQIPIALFKSGFFGSTSNVLSAHSGEHHSIHSAKAHGATNTLKLEMPELGSFKDPVARFEQIGPDLVYETYDVGTPKGNQIMSTLKAGLSTGDTSVSVPSKTPIATWWRFI